MSLSPASPAASRYEPALAHEPESVRLPTLVTPRLTLRWLEMGDIDDLFELFSNSAALRYWSHAPFAHRDDASIYLEAIQRGFARGDLFQWGICANEGGPVVGTCTLAHIDTAHARAEVGFLLSPAVWGKGLGREALGAVIDHAFGALGLRRLEADVDPRNLRSVRALEALGFKREGLLRQRWLVNGEWQDSLLLGLLQSDRVRAG